MDKSCEVLGEGDRTRVDVVTAISVCGVVRIGPLGSIELCGVLDVPLERVKTRVGVARRVATVGDSAAISL